MTAVDDRLLALAADVGRLRRRLRDESRDNPYTAFVAGRVAAHVDVLVHMHEATAGDLYRAGLPIDHALDTVDERAEALEQLLGGGW